MKSMKKVALIIIAIMLIMQLSACSTFGKKKLTTPTGVELSTPLSETIKFFSRVKVVYITVGSTLGVGNTPDMNGDKVISDEDFYEIALIGNEFRAYLKQKHSIMLRWYDIEASGKFSNRDQLVAEVKREVLEHLRAFIETAKVVKGVSQKDAQVIESAISMVETLYSVRRSR